MGTNLLRIRNFSTFIKIVLTFWCVELREILYYKYLVVTNIQSVYILENQSFLFEFDKRYLAYKFLSCCESSCAQKGKSSTFPRPEKCNNYSVIYDHM
jgi:hypothetical protein